MEIFNDIFEEFAPWEKFASLGKFQGCRRLFNGQIGVPDVGIVTGPNTMAVTRPENGRAVTCRC